MLDGHDAFPGREVRQQRCRHYIANRIDTFLSRLLILIDLDKAFFDFDLSSFQTETLGERHAPDGHQEHFGFESDVLAFGGLAGDDDTGLGFLELLQFCIKLRFNPALAKGFGQLG